uniref:Uncharacterized protein n=1 Tax=Siphoviridae sp. ct1IF5 TaxID=2827765 RepID=A0A8S5TF76_9CAUD|nr:MAG TPA: hypothetical protein [Siphoviridae sp. ct1IF5]DAJ72841.1 MAG TPA: hypothetical protein [Caudoviricetes sp.]
MKIISVFTDSGKKLYLKFGKENNKWRHFQ